MCFVISDELLNPHRVMLAINLIVVALTIIGR